LIKASWQIDYQGDVLLRPTREDSFSELPQQRGEKERVEVYLNFLNLTPYDPADFFIAFQVAVMLH
jgi:hypothetical protein